MRLGLIAALFLVVSVASGQITDQVVQTSNGSGYLETTWEKIQFSSAYYRIVQADIDYDTTSAHRSPLLYYAFNNDTSSTKIMILRPGDAVRHTGLGLTHIYIKASADSLPYRVAIYR